MRDPDSRIAASNAFDADKSGASILVSSDDSVRGVDYLGVTRVIQFVGWDEIHMFTETTLIESTCLNLSAQTETKVYSSEKAASMPNEKAPKKCTLESGAKNQKKVAESSQAYVSVGSGWNRPRNPYRAVPCERCAATTTFIKLRPKFCQNSWMKSVSAKLYLPVNVIFKSEPNNILRFVTNGAYEGVVIGGDRYPASTLH
ncbi:hypothetical protein EDD22DRAFT_851800 [Suillus occidentalis]|nr:hypothetical protein EDD22DRAFT_851800 [Suillus occidentalis]